MLGGWLSVVGCCVGWFVCVRGCLLNPFAFSNIFLGCFPSDLLCSNCISAFVAGVGGCFVALSCSYLLVCVVVLCLLGAVVAVGIGVAVVWWVGWVV